MEDLLSHCFQAVSLERGVLATFFFGGLTGGFTHCLVMCGPFVACERACKSKKCGAANDAGGNATLSYHLGRLTTYGALGFTVALLSKQVAALPWWPAVSSFMLALAGVLFLLSCLKSCGHSESGSSSRGSLSLTYMRGTLLGFMPCGLLYAALMMTATLADPFLGMFAMLLFGLGTVPALMIASGGVVLLNQRWQNRVQSAGRAMMAFNGLSLLVMAAKLVR